MHDSNGKGAQERHEKIIQVSDLISQNLNKKLEYTRIGAEAPSHLAEEHARLTAQLTQLQAEKAAAI